MTQLLCLDEKTRKSKELFFLSLRDISVAVAPGFELDYNPDKYTIHML